MDVFEATTESARGETKKGYITDELTVDALRKSLTEHRNIDKILGAWSSSMSYLLENL